MRFHLTEAERHDKDNRGKFDQILVRNAGPFINFKSY